jgi:hypothetical protein
MNDDTPRDLRCLLPLLWPEYVTIQYIAHADSDHVRASDGYD